MGKLTHYGVESVTVLDSFPVEVKVLDNQGVLLYSTWSVATPMIRTRGYSDNYIDIGYTTDLTYYHRCNEQSTVTRFEVWRGGHLFSSMHCNISMRKGDSLRLFGKDKPGPDTVYGIRHSL